jgi:hypothetical protein
MARSFAARQLALALVAVAVGPALAGCEQPAPSVSVFSGASSDHREALCWSDDAEPIDIQSCLSVTGDGAADKAETLGDALGSIEVRADATIGISVDAEVAERGWFVTLGSNRINVNPITDSYYRFSLPSDVVEQSEEIPMYVMAVSDDSDDITGVWVFELLPATGH